MQPTVKGFLILIFGKASRAYPLVDQTSAICTSLASSVESFILATSMPWTFLQFLLCVVAQKMLKAFFVLRPLCIHIHQERGSQLSTWIYKIYPMILHKEKLRFLVSFLFLKHNNILKCAKMTQNRHLNGASLLKLQQSHNGAP